MSDYKAIIEKVLMNAMQQGASDVHMSPGYYPTLRINGRLIPLQDFGVLTNDTTKFISDILMPQAYKEAFEKYRDIDFNYSFQDLARLRVNVYHTRGNIAIVLHVIPQKILSIQDLFLPQSVQLFTKL